jgi:hypothetical protein
LTSVPTVKFANSEQVPECERRTQDSSNQCAFSQADERAISISATDIHTSQRTGSKQTPVAMRLSDIIPIERSSPGYAAISSRDTDGLPACIRNARKVSIFNTGTRVNASQRTDSGKIPVRNRCTDILTNQHTTAGERPVSNCIAHCLTSQRTASGKVAIRKRSAPRLAVDRRGFKHNREDVRTALLDDIIERSAEDVSHESLIN